MELKNEWITNYVVEQGVTGRLLGYGHVIFSTPGYATGASKMVNVSNPTQVKVTLDSTIKDFKTKQEVSDKLKRLEEEYSFGRVDAAKYQELKTKYQQELQG